MFYPANYNFCDHIKHTRFHIIEVPGGEAEKASAPPLQYSCLENPMVGGAWWLQSMGLLRVGHD